MHASNDATIVFIGGGNMAAALVAGLVRAGRAPGSIVVAEPDGGRRAALEREHGVATVAAAADAADTVVAEAVVWAVKPQVFAAAASAFPPQLGGALQLSVMAGVRSDAIARATGSERVVRAMPNTPALIGRGIAGVHARHAVSNGDRALAAALLAPSGAIVWFDDEAALDAVTAVSGSGPAYVFLLIEALADAGIGVGLDADAARKLAVETVAGAAALAAGSAETPAELRRRVTSPRGTTEAAVAVLEQRGVRDAFAEAVRAARDRARELGDALAAGS